MRHTLSVIAGMLLLTACGCREAYYSTMEKLGHPKRELLVERVEKARDTQEEAKEQFKSALDQFITVLNVDGGELEEKYRRLNDEYEQSEDKAREVERRINDVKSVAKSLFNEWEDELKEYTNPELRRKSEDKLEQTRQQYDQLISAMERAEEKIQPVLAAFRDQVLYLKHNLNAQAIASLQGELDRVETNVNSLVAEMERSITEANEFITKMGL